jgi:hypothetical protein
MSLNAMAAQHQRLASRNHNFLEYMQHIWNTYQEDRWS